MTRPIWNTLATLAVLIFTALPLSAAEVVTYYHNDHLGSPIAATDSTGAVVWQQAYDPWGFKLTTNTDERGYTGNWLDEETGLADHKARWYTSSIGRFTGIDPVEWHESNIHSFNRYAYASNNPYANVDRDGRNAVTFLGGLAVESYNALSGNGFNGSRVLGALADGYNGEGAGFARSLYQDAESFVPIGAVAGALIKSGRLAKAAVTKGSERAATGFKGGKGFEFKNAPYQKVRNEATTINGRDFSGHALDQMQNRGIMPSVVENTIKTGQTFSTRAGTTGFYDSVNNVRAITNSDTGRIVTVIRGAPN